MNMRIATKGPLGLKPDTKPKADRRKPMRQVSKKLQAYRQSPEGKAGREYMAMVRMLPCVVCGTTDGVEAHHCFHGRYGQRKTDDTATIPLCIFHHRIGPDAIHRAKEAWATTYGPDYTYIEQARQQVSNLVDDLTGEWL